MRVIVSHPPSPPHRKLRANFSVELAARLSAKSKKDGSEIGGLGGKRGLKSNVF